MRKVISMEIYGGMNIYGATFKWVKDRKWEMKGEINE